MTLKEIQAQYGNGVWLLLSRAGLIDCPVYFETDTRLVYLGHDDEWIVRDSYRDHFNDWTVLDVEVTGEADLAGLSNRPVDQSECTRQSCPDIFKGHSVGCRYFK